MKAQLALPEEMRKFLNLKKIFNPDLFFILQTQTLQCVSLFFFLVQICKMLLGASWKKFLAPILGKTNLLL